jgi:hypothetical protein
MYISHVVPFHCETMVQYHSHYPASHPQGDPTPSSYFAVGMSFFSPNSPNTSSKLSHVSTYPVHPAFLALLIPITRSKARPSTKPKNPHVALSKTSWSNPSLSDALPRVLDIGALTPLDQIDGLLKLRGFS